MNLFDNWYRLEGRTPVRIKDITEITSGRVHVGDSTINGYRISTVFLGIDHNRYGEGPPELFETMIFRGPYDEHQWRYATWEEAERGHAVACDLVRGISLWRRIEWRIRQWLRRDK